MRREESKRLGACPLPPPLARLDGANVRHSCFGTVESTNVFGKRAT